MIKVIQHSTEERKQINSEKWEEYRNMYYTTELNSNQMLKKLDVCYGSETYRHIKSQIKKEKVSPHKRAKLIQYGRWLS